jgi:hypothetical protein
MKTLLKSLVIVISLSLIGGNAMYAQQFKYIGADKCKMCHNKPEKGDQYKKWAESLHAQSLKSLSSPAALEYAKKNGIADPAKDAKCLKCHSTYGSVDAAQIATLLPTEGVSCESCHGPGSMYKSPAIMKNKDQAVKSGLVIPTQATCEKCHNKENPYFKPFDYAKMSAKIAHPAPKV